MIAAASLHAQITDVGLSTAERHSTLRMTMSGPARGGLVVRRDGDLTRVSLQGTGLGRSFSGGDRFQWQWTPGPDGVGPKRAHTPESVWIERGRGDVTVSVRLSGDISVEPRQEASAVVLVFRKPRAPVAMTRVEIAPPPPPALPPAPLAAVSETLEPPSPEREVLVAELLGTLPARESEVAEGADTEDLVRRLFPHRAAATPAPKRTTTAEAATDGAAAGTDRTLRVGPLEFDPTLRFAYVDATSNVASGTDAVRDRYWEIRPGLGLGTAFWDGRLRAQYEPALRAFGSFGPTRSTSHRARVSLDVAPGRRTQVVAYDAWATGILEVNEVDPGSEYFFDLQRFTRNSVGLTVRRDVAPRWKLEAGGGLDQVRFKTAGTLFDHDTQTLNLGLDYELTPKARVSVGWVHERIPRSAERPAAESTANALEAVVNSQAAPRLSVQAMLGLREQKHPFAGAEGRRYRGLVLGGSLTRILGLSSSLTLGGNRTVLVSAFENNGFYVTNQVQADVVTRVPHGFFLDGGLGYRWNEYSTVATEIGAPRDDGIFDWGAGLRRPLKWGTVGVSYRRQVRRSNIDRFDISTDRLALHLDFDVFQAAGLR